MRTTIDRPFSPVEPSTAGLEAFSLSALSARARESAEYQRSGKASLTLVRSEPLTVVLIALRAGGGLREHHAPASAAVTVLSGEIDFSAEGEVTALAGGEAMAFAANLPHAVTARTDADLLLVIGGHEYADRRSGG